MEKGLEMKSIGILYIATGPYINFWKDFYLTFEKYFLPDFKKNYYVFTDAESFEFEANEGVHKYFINNQPWPLITLLRFHYFLSIEDELKVNDYLMFSNANIICCEEITPEEFLPDAVNKELSFTTHPGFVYKKPVDFVYDRNPKSTAYIPYNCGTNYVIGALFAGTTEAFLSMSKELKNNINIDLNNRVIAQWHDESHLNHYAASHDNWRLLSPGYCYPVGFDLPFEKKITGVPKKTVFDVDSFKGYTSDVSLSTSDRVAKGIKNRQKKLEKSFNLFIDTILNKKVK